jgi:hypothetical protein
LSAIGAAAEDPGHRQHVLLRLGVALLGHGEILTIGDHAGTA